MSEGFDEQLCHGTVRGRSSLNGLNVVTQEVRKTSIFNPERLAGLAAIKKVDRTRNGGSGAGKHVQVLVEGWREEITIAAPVMAKELMFGNVPVISRQRSSSSVDPSELAATITMRAVSSPGILCPSVNLSKLPCMHWRQVRCQLPGGVSHLRTVLLGRGNVIAI